MKVLLFAGTTEGRELAGFLSAHGVDTLACVATDYGKEVLPPLPYVTVHSGRMQESEMRVLMRDADLVIDATHPYATEVTKTIRAAADAQKKACYRLVRPQGSTDHSVITVSDSRQAASFLNTVTGAVLLTTGSKELESFTAVYRYQERIWPRVLPSAEVLQKCAALGFPAAHIIAMQGPFSRQLNEAMLRQIQAKYLVTKDGGDAGGFSEKLEAAAAAGVTVIVIGRPAQENGMTILQMQSFLKEQLGLTALEKQPRFPLFVDLRGRRCVVIGAGSVGKRRAEMLRSFGAQVTVVAPEPGEIRPDIEKQYESEDLQGAFLAVAATSDRQVNKLVAADCKKAGIWCSVADDAEASTMYFPAICKSQHITVGVISDGQQHCLVSRTAARIRKLLQEDEA